MWRSLSGCSYAAALRPPEPLPAIHSTPSDTFTTFYTRPRRGPRYARRRIRIGDAEGACSSLVA